MNEKNEAMSDQLPDRLSTDRRALTIMKRCWRVTSASASRASRKPTSRVLCQRGLGACDRSNAKDRYGNPLTIKVHGPVEPYFRDKRP